MMERPWSWRAAKAASHLMQHQTGIVIPVYLPEGVDRCCGEALLEDTAEAYCALVADPAVVCLSVDGEPFGSGFVRQLARRLRTSIYVAPDNRGKLGAAIDGVRVLLETPGLQYVAVVDQDGDHFANELPNLLRAALHIARCAGEDRILILGRRISRHRPLGFLRGELEEFADRVLMDALSYSAAKTGKPLRLQFAGLLDEFPDFHSGYKLFSRCTAQQVFLGEPQLAGVSAAGYYRHACEAVMVVEALEHGACLGVVNRSTFNEQPISTFGLMDLSRLVADKIIWPCRRLDVPLPFVRQWMANHSPRLLLNTLLPSGKGELERVKQLVIASLTGGQDKHSDPDLQPLFV